MLGVGEPCTRIGQRPQRLTRCNASRQNANQSSGKHGETNPMSLLLLNNNTELKPLLKTRHS